MQKGAHARSPEKPIEEVAKVGNQCSIFSRPWHFEPVLPSAEDPTPNQLRCSIFCSLSTVSLTVAVPGGAQELRNGCRCYNSSVSWIHIHVALNRSVIRIKVTGFQRHWGGCVAVCNLLGWWIGFAALVADMFLTIRLTSGPSRTSFRLGFFGLVWVCCCQIGFFFSWVYATAVWFKLQSREITDRLIRSLDQQICPFQPTTELGDCRPMGGGIQFEASLQGRFVSRIYGMVRG